MVATRTWSGARLREIREGMGLTIEQLSRQLEINMANISRWERGKVTPSANNAAELADRLGVDLNEFYENGKAA